MSTSNTRLGPNSLIVSYSAGTSNAEFLSAMDSAMAAQGWELYDAAAIGGTNAHCYRAAVADGTVAYKYLVLDVNSAGYMLSRVYESWNATTHIGNNLSHQSDFATYGQQTSFSTGGLMYVFATPRYALFFSKLSNLTFGSVSFGSFSGCIEISRDNVEEIPGQTPIFGWVNGGLIIGGLANTSSYTHCMALPRSRAGLNLAAGSTFQSIGTIFGRSLCDNSNGATYPLWRQIPVASNPISSNNNFVFTPYSIDQAGGTVNSLMHVRGRLYGIKILARNLGSPLDVTQIKTDGVGFFDPSSVSATPHVIIAENSFNCRFALPL